ncbi:hypothetical protein [Azospirillum sp. sgz302134]
MQSNPTDSWNHFVLTREFVVLLLLSDISSIPLRAALRVRPRNRPGVEPHVFWGAASHRVFGIPNTLCAELPKFHAAEIQPGLACFFPKPSGPARLCRRCATNGATGRDSGQQTHGLSRLLPKPMAYGRTLGEASTTEISAERMPFAYIYTDLSKTRKEV